ncbi:MAG: HAD-IC family P-type ATPase, partial [Promicromonosporaceae bacterium]|nr:HAD-IC family P-type ATPase [Promicromonosporaceae bacterium]
QIVRANVFTPVNAVLSTLLAVTLATGSWRNALFGFVIFFNSLIGIVQELHSRRTLDQLAIVNAPIARAVRDAELVKLAVNEVVADDLLELRTGDQVPADGVLRSATGLEADEALLTGESDPIPKGVGDEVRSGSIIVAGTGRFQATGVGADSYAAQLAAQARRFSLTHSELRAGTNRLLKGIAIVMAISAPIVAWRQWGSVDNETWREAVTSTVAAMVGMVPDGLVLLTSMAFALGVVSLARKQTLVQELAAVEGLARVDVLCLDKTGTLTYGDIELDRVVPLDDVPDGDVANARIANALGLLSGDGTNATAAAIGQHHPTTEWVATGQIPFSSARKWSAVTAEGNGTWVLGAPEMVLPSPASVAERAARAEADAIAATGSRVLLLAHANAPAEPATEGEAALPAALAPVALVVLAERARDDAAETLAYFAEQGVALKVISGDNPRTVGAVAARVGVPGVSGADDAIDARELPEEPGALADVLAANSVFGRVTPAQKQAMVTALQSRGHVVAMTGDGVNDALALKDADIGVAMGSGSPATKAVAQLVLLDGKFAHLPHAVAEGRRVIANIERAANLFLTRNSYAFVLAIVTAITASAYPFEPIQLTLISSLTIGVPGFFLALGPNRRRYIPGFLGRVMRFAIPAGLIVAAGAYTGFRVTRWLEPESTAADARTTSTLVVLIICLWILTLMARPWAVWKIALVGALGMLGAVAVAVPSLAHGLFLLEITTQRVFTAAAIGALGIALVTVAYALANRKPPAVILGD